MRLVPETFNRQDWPRLVAQAVNRINANFEETAEAFIRVTSGADQNLPTGVLTILDYDTTETNNASGTFSVSTSGRITVAETGIYDISTGVVIEASAIDALSAANLGIFVNGNLVAVDTAETTLGVSQSRGQSIATQIALTAGDIVDARVRATTVSGVGNGVARRTAVLLGSTATQVNHLSIAKCSSVIAGGIGDASDAWNYLKLTGDFVTSSATAVDITGLAFTPAANTQYEFEALLLLRTATTTVGPRPGLAWPTGGTDGVAEIIMPTSGTADVLVYGNVNAALLAAVGGLPDTTQSYPARIRGTFVAGASPSGTIKLQMASETGGTNVTVKAGSFLKYRAI